MPPFRRISAVLGIIGLSAAAAACPASDQGPTMSTAQVMMETQDAIIGVNNELAILQDQIDSLRGALNIQDSLIRVMFNLSGNPLPPKPVIPPE